MIPSRQERFLSSLEASRRLRPGGRAVEKLLEQANRIRLSDPRQVIRLHDSLLFLRAYPHSFRVLSLAEAALSKFFRRVAGLDPDRLEPFDESENAGIAGTAVAMTFSYETVRWLESRFGPRLRIDWDVFDQNDRLGALLARLIPMLEEQTSADANVSYRAVLHAACGKAKQRELTWLLKGLSKLRLPIRDAAVLYDGLALQIWWELKNGRASRTFMKVKGARIFFQDEPLLTRKEISLEAEIATTGMAPPLVVRRLSRRAGESALDLARAVLAVRYRELFTFIHGDPAGVLLADAGRGVQIQMNGVIPERRLPLRAAFGFLVLKNGVPVGYGDALGLFERLEVSFNIFPAFREGESAFIYARLLRLFHDLLGAWVFSIEPYQFGLHNEEAIASGAFWFYRKLGFRSTDPALERLARREEVRISRTPTPSQPALLRRLAGSPLVYEVAGTSPGDWDRFRIGRLTEEAGSGAPSEVSIRRLIEKLGLVEAGLRGGPCSSAFERLAPLLARIPALARWSRIEKETLVRTLAVKGAGSEVAFLRLLQKQKRLREALLTLGTASRSS